MFFFRWMKESERDRGIQVYMNESLRTLSFLGFYSLWQSMHLPAIVSIGNKIALLCVPFLSRAEDEAACSRRSYGIALENRLARLV